MLTGNLIGPYEVLAKLGEGGMGDVYKARDTRLDHFVAIKILGDALSAAHRRGIVHRDLKPGTATTPPNLTASLPLARSSTRWSPAGRGSRQRRRRA